MKFDFFAGRDMPKGDLFLIEGQPTVSVDHSCFFQAEHVFGGSVRFGKDERPEQGPAGSSGLGKAIIGDLARCGVNLEVIIAMDLFLENLADFLDRGELFQGGCADDAVLEPTVGTFDLALGLG
jgi:hypothetical protein